MIVEIDSYMQRLVEKLRVSFNDRLVYVGLQGSYMRGEESDNSDIDPMVVIDSMSVADLDEYRRIVETLECTEKSCGFICSKRDLQNWNRLEICHLVHSTKDIYGKLCELVPEYTAADLLSYVKLSINNIQHELCHRRIHSSRRELRAAFPSICKNLFFVLQDFCYLKTGVFAADKKELFGILSGEDKGIFEMSLSVMTGRNFSFEESFERLYSWCGEALEQLSR